MLPTRTLLLLLLALSLSSSVAVAQAPPDYAKERAEMAEGLTAPFDWLSLVALEWLRPGVTTVGSAPGNTVILANAPAHLLSIKQEGGKVVLVAANPALRLGRRSVQPGATLSDGEAAADALSAGTLRLWAIQRGDRRYLRIKDSNAPARLHFHGLRWYAPDPSFRITARWIPYTTPHSFTTHNQIGQSYSTSVPGYVEFTRNGTAHTLLPLNTSGGQLWFVFRDETYRSETYGGGRFLYAGLPSNGLSNPGTVILDFNEAYNPPCAYSPYATCPMAAPENRLPFAIPAGEKRYTDDEEGASAATGLSPAPSVPR